MEIIKANTTDLVTVENLIDLGKEKMRESGNMRQWEPGYPSHEQLLTDILKGHSYIVVDDGKPVATFAFIPGPDDTYRNIDGRWLNDEPYCVIHRIASAPGARGVFKRILDYCSRQTANIRIDTHADNQIMQHLLLGAGFQYCGIIEIPDHGVRLAYQMKCNRGV